MQGREPLYAVELVKVLEEATSELRHDLRNRMGSIRNMAFYVAKRLTGSELAEKDARLGQFLKKIDDEVEIVDQLLERWADRVERVHRRNVQAIRTTQTVELAASSARIPAEVELDVACEDALIEGDSLEFALAVRCLIENAAEAAPRGTVVIRGRAEAGVYRLRVSDQGPGIDPARALRRLESEKAAHLGLGLCMAQRVMQSVGGKLVFGAAQGGTSVELEVPLAGSRTPTPSAAESE